MRTLLLVLLLSLAGWASPITINLNPGWNPVAFQASRLTRLEVGPGVVGLAYFANSEYEVRAYTPERVDPRRGCYVYATQATTLTYDGFSETQGSAELTPGWNLLSTATYATVVPYSGFPAGTAVPPGQIIWVYALTPGRATWGLPLTSLTVTPANLTLTRYSHAQLTAKAGLTDGTTQDVTSQVEWTSSVPSAGAIASDGVLTALFPTAVVITAKLAGREAKADLLVTDSGVPPTPSPERRREGRIFASSFDDNAVRVFDSVTPGNVAPLTSLLGIAGARDIFVVPERDEIWITSQTLRTVRAFRRSTLASLRSFSTFSNTLGLYYDNANDCLYVCQATNQVNVFNNASTLNGGTRTPDRIITGFARPPLDIWLDSNRLFVTAGDAGLYIFDNALAPASPRRINPGNSFLGLALDPARQRLYLGTQDEIYVYNNAATVDNPTAPDARIIGFRGRPVGLYFDGDRDELYAALDTSSVLVYSTQTLALVHSLAGPLTGLKSAFGVWYDANAYSR